MSHVNSDVHPVLHAGRVAVITGAASGIGKAAAVEMAKCVSAVALDSASEILTNVICLR
jgi:NAD(P)-dependent dehydrogenase (short-subunit alcohol dehydrogenase family)